MSKAPESTARSLNATSDLIELKVAELLQHEIERFDEPEIRLRALALQPEERL